MRRFPVVPLSTTQASAALWLLLDVVRRKESLTVWQKDRRKVASSPLGLRIQVQHRCGKQELAGAPTSILVSLLAYTGIIPNVCCLQDALTHWNDSITQRYACVRLVGTTTLCIWWKKQYVYLYTIFIVYIERNICLPKSLQADYQLNPKSENNIAIESEVSYLYSHPTVYASLFQMCGEC